MLCFSLKSVLVGLGSGEGGGIWRHLALLSLGRVLRITAILEALSEKQTISYVPGFCQFPALNLSAPGLLALPEPQISCTLSQAGPWDQNSKFKGPSKVQTRSPSPIPGGESLSLHCPILSPKSSCIVCTERLEFLVLLSEKLEPGYWQSLPYSDPTPFYPRKVVSEA